MPREWYAAARQSVRPQETGQVTTASIVEESDEDDESKEGAGSSRNLSPSRTRQPDVGYAAQKAARNELNAHELLALLSCFISPFVGAWLLHAIRSQLSRPSEGLVSNYNLTVFLLAAEIRPLSHLAKMVQARTLYLQRKAASRPADADIKQASETINDIVKRLEDLEAHVVESADDKDKEISQETLATKTAAQVISDVRKGVQPELNALNRAVRRYEKRATISSLQTDTRLQDLELRLNDIVVLAAAAQRNSEARNRGGIIHSMQSFGTALLGVPGRLCWTLLQLPSSTLQWALALAHHKAPTKAKSFQTRTVRQAKDAKLRDRKGKGLV